MSSNQINKTPRQKTAGLSPSKRITRSRAKKTFQKNKQIRSQILKKQNILKETVANSTAETNDMDDFNIEDNTPLTRLKNVQPAESDPTIPSGIFFLMLSLIRMFVLKIDNTLNESNIFQGFFVFSKIY